MPNLKMPNWASQTAYRASPKGKATQAAYNSSPKGKASRKAYRISAKGKATNAAYRAVRNATRYSNDLQFKITCVLRSRLSAALKGNYKTGSAVRDLGCSVPELIEYFKSLFLEGMSWENHGEWHIDHIVPLTAFDLEDPEQLKKACHFTNLQPLWALDNILKGAKQCEE